ncbi:MAG: zinc-ribbon domain-containing protein [Saccharofermentanales bacterium]
MYCSNCGQQLPEDAEFCPFCGEKTDIEELLVEGSPPGNLQPPYSDSQLYIPATNEEVAKRSHIPKWVLIVLSIAGCLIIFLLAWLGIRSVKKLSDNKTPSDLKVSAPNKESFATQTPTAGKETAQDKTKETTQNTTQEPAQDTQDTTQESAQDTAQEAAQEPGAVKLEEGEYLYVGNTSFFDIEDFELSFILSADKTYIRDFSIRITNLNTSFDRGNVRTELSLAKATQIFPGTYPIDFDGSNHDILLGKSIITGLYFNDETAYVEMEYTYVDSSTGPDGQEIEIPLGPAWIDLCAYDNVEEAKRNEETFTDMSEEEIKEAETPVYATTEIRHTVFDESLLKNWNDQAMQEAFGVDSIFEFTPSNPQPMHYIVSTDGVYDPVTGKESMGGYTRNFSRHCPISANTLIRVSGELKEGGLTLTDDPNRATFALVLHFSYTDDIGTYRYEDGSIIDQYHSTLRAELVNLVTDKVLESEIRKAQATYTYESVYTSMLDAAKGKQLYGDAPFLCAEDFPGYWNFVNK